MSRANLFRQFSQKPPKNPQDFPEGFEYDPSFDREGSHSNIAGACRGANVLHIYDELEYSEFLDRLVSVWDERPGVFRGVHFSERFTKLHPPIFDLDFIFESKTHTHVSAEVLEHFEQPILKLVEKYWPHKDIEVIFTAVDATRVDEEEKAQFKGGLHIYITSHVLDEDGNATGPIVSNGQQGSLCNELRSLYLGAEDSVVDLRGTGIDFRILDKNGSYNHIVDHVQKLRIVCCKKEAMGRGAQRGVRGGPRFYHPVLSRKWSPESKTWSEPKTEWNEINQLQLGSDERAMKSERRRKTAARRLLLTKLSGRVYGERGANGPTPTATGSPLDEFEPEKKGTREKFEPLAEDDERIPFLKSALFQFFHPLASLETFAKVFEPLPRIKMTTSKSGSRQSKTGPFRWYLLVNYCPFHPVQRESCCSYSKCIDEPEVCQVIQHRKPKPGLDAYKMHSKNRSFIEFSCVEGIGYVSWRSFHGEGGNWDEDGLLPLEGACYFKRLTHHITSVDMHFHIFQAMPSPWKTTSEQYLNFGASALIFEDEREQEESGEPMFEAAYKICLQNRRNEDRRNSLECLGSKHLYDVLLPLQ